MKKIFAIVFLLTGIFVYSQSKSQISINVDSIVKLKIEEKVKPYVEKIDSLTKQIELDKRNENYFTTALSSQTAIFSVIVAVLFIIIGYVSYSQFKAEVKDVEKKYQESIDNYSKISEILNETHSDLYVSLGALHSRDGFYGLSIKFYLRGISNMNLKVDSKEYIIENIKDVNTIIAEFKQQDIDDLIEDKSIVLEYLNAIKIDDNDVLNELSKIRIILNEKMNNA